MSREQFDAMFRGETRTRFKMIVDPDTGKMYRLVNTRGGSSLTAESPSSYYAEMEPRKIDIYEFALNKDKATYLREEQKSLEKPYYIRSFHVQTNPKKQQKLNGNELNRLQYYELEKAVGLSSRWWPLEGLTWRALGDLKKTEISVLMNDQMPVGYVAIEDCTPKGHQPPIMAIAMVGLIPGQRGNGFGSYLVKWAVRKISAERPNAKIILWTSDSDKKKDNKPASELYEKLGFEIYKITTFDVSKLIVDHRKDLSKLDLCAAYVPDTYHEEPGTDRKLPRFREEEVERRLRKAFKVPEK